MQIIGLSGGAGTGKDYIHESVLRPLGFWRVSFADHFKNWMVGQGLGTYEEIHITKPPHVRKLLQQEGTKLREELGPDIWTNTLGVWMKHWNRTWGLDKFCITDVRFPNEVEFVQSMGGKVARILAPNRYADNGMDEASRSHLSERALDDYEGFDWVLLNDYEDYDLREQVFACLLEHGYVGTPGRPLSLSAR